jgi:hypothetical protein
MITQGKVNIDGIIRPKMSRQFFGWENSNEILKSPRGSMMLKNKIRINNFYSNNLGYSKLEANSNFSMDGIRIQSPEPLIVKTFSDYSNNQQIDIYGTLQDRYRNVFDYIRDIISGSLPRVNLVHAWNFSIVASIIFGMFLMTMVYRYLGRSASAGTVEIDMRPVKNELVAEASPANSGLNGQALSSEEEKERTQLLEDYQNKIQDGLKNGTMEKELKNMVKGYPIEKMIPYIVEKDKKVAAFLVGIAKKESNWGKISPELKGQDCFNYWGYKSINGEDSSGAYACFDNPKEAVDIVGKRMETFINKKNLTDPGKMVTAWKCGYDCSWDDPGAVRKWVSDVKMYYDEVVKMK